MTPSREEYLYKLKDLTENSHTGNYLAEVIGKVIEKIGPNKISAIVSDNAANVRSARNTLQDKYPNIENIRCIAHAINLIACDITKKVLVIVYCGRSIFWVCFLKIPIKRVQNLNSSLMKIIFAAEVSNYIVRRGGPPLAIQWIQ